MSVESPYARDLRAVPVKALSVDVLGSTTRYWEYGAVTVGAPQTDTILTTDPADVATTIVLVHGFRGDHHGLEPVIAELGGAVRIIAPDLPGFGASDRLLGREHSVAGYGDWLAAFIDALDLQDAVVLGHSFGSIVVSGAVAAGLPVKRLVLVNPIAAPALAGPSGILTRLAVFYYWLAAALPERAGFALLRNRVIVRVMSIAMAKTRDPRLRRWIHDQHDRYFSVFSDRRVVLEAFTASVSSDVSHFAPSITVPTLLIAAAEDQITSVAAERRLQALFPDARLIVIPDVGHLIHYETPKPAALAIETFLTETAERS
ncbi:alpha/beta hydrolase [Salinibacterium sp. ZJ454]|uniref:alpha/beta fold hydrolase n=1 Tax=Salinibacterium sp. ZJ454 TaxID=2708339 RepID=UPI0014225C4F|nr:alpha/beta hydrolase [Salinibacterium sp. ZJ454]